MSDVKKYAPMGWNSWDCYGAGVTELWSKEKAEIKMTDGSPAVCARIKPHGAVVFEIH